MLNPLLAPRSVIEVEPMTTRTYARVYHQIVDDPMFERVYDNDHALSTWLRMLLMADAMWPASAPMTSRNPTVRMLIDCGLVIEKPGNRYSIRGLDADRERRSTSARNAAAVRWHSEGNAKAMPSRTEQNKEEQVGANAPNRPANGNAMGWGGRGLHDGRHGQECDVCYPPGSKKLEAVK